MQTKKNRIVLRFDTNFYRTTCCGIAVAYSNKSSTKQSKWKCDHSSPQ